MKQSALSLTTWLSLFLLTLQASHAGLLGTPTVITSGVQPENWVHVADMDGSGRGSILYSPQPGVLHLLRKNQGSFAPAQVLISGGVARVRGVQTADFNGTGRLDIAVAFELPDGSFAIRVLYGNAFDFAPISSLFLAAFDAPCSLAVEDFNRDGAPDIAVADNARSEVRIFPGPDFVGSSPFATVTPPLRLIAENDGADKWPDLLVLSGGFDTLNNQSIQNDTNTTGSFTGASPFPPAIPQHLVSEQRHWQHVDRAGHPPCGLDSHRCRGRRYQPGRASRYTMEVMGTTSTVWIARDYPGYEKFKKEMSVLEKLAGPEVKAPEMPGLALKTVTEAGGATYTTLMISLKEGKVDDALFTVPEGYKGIGE